MLVVRHQIAVARVALGQAAQKRVDAVVVAPLLFAELAVVLLDEFFDFLFVHLHQTLAVGVHLVDFFTPNGTKTHFNS